jgi:hypothetical protein
MGFIRGGLLVIVSVLLFSSFLAGNFFLTLTLSLDYDTIQPELVSVVSELSEDEINLRQVIDEELPFMEEYCQNNSEYVFSDQGHTFVIPCSVVSQGSDAIISYGLNTLVEEVYYKEYDCDFWKCLEKTGDPFFLVSEKAKDYWKQKFYFSLIASIILVALAFILIEKRTSLPILVGIMLIASGIPFLIINWISFNWIPLPMFGEYFVQLFTIFFAKSYTVFLISFILGLIVLGIGILSKFFSIGFKISNFFSKKKKGISKKEVKNIVKEEISKDKKKK